MLSFTEEINQHKNSNSIELSSLMKKIKRQTFAKNTILQNAGDEKISLFYVKSGLLRSYTIDDKGKEHIFMFAPEGWLIADGSINSGATELFIDALENTEVEVIDQKDFLELFLPLTALNDSKRSEVMMRRMAVMQKRIIMLISASAIERYEHFTKTYPGISQRVPQKMIASYLGITPEALSKVKGTKARGK